MQANAEAHRAMSGPCPVADSFLQFGPHADQQDGRRKQPAAHAGRSDRRAWSVVRKGVRNYSENNAATFKFRSSSNFFRSAPQAGGPQGHRLLLEHESMTKRDLRRARFRWKDWLLGSHSGQWIFMLSSGTVLVIFGAFLWFYLCEESTADYDHDWEGSIWFSWIIFFDPGTQTSMPQDDPIGIKLIAVVLSVCGFVYNLSFLGMVVELVHSTLENWKFHYSRIVLTGHVLVLGWTGKTLFLLSELLHYDLTEGKMSQIVVMADRDETEMSKEIKSHFGKESKMRRLMRYIKVRTGDPSDTDHLDRVSASSAREVIVLGYGQAQDPDLQVVRVVIALAALDEALTGRVVAEVQRQEHAYALTGMLPGADGICARIAVNCVLCLLTVRPAVGFTFVSLLASDEQESSLYSAEIHPSHDGKSFADASFLFPRAICMGVRSVEGKVIFAPPADYVLRVGEKILFIAQNQRAICHWSQWSPGDIAADSLATLKKTTGEVSEKAISTTVHAGEVGVKVMCKVKQGVRASTNVLFPHVLTSKPSLQYSASSRVYEDNGRDTERATSSTTSETHVFVVIGWTADLPEIITVLDRLLPPSTVIHVLSQKSIPKRELKMKDRHLSNVQLQHYVGELTSVYALSLVPLHEARTILVLSEIMAGLSSSGDKSNEDITCDATSLTCVQMVAGILEGRFGEYMLGSKEHQPLIICELLDPRADRVLARSQALRQKAFFFRRGALETGIFHQASISPTIFNSFWLLLAQSAKLHNLQSAEPAFDIAVVPIHTYAVDLAKGMVHSGTTQASQSSSTSIFKNTLLPIGKIAQVQALQQVQKVARAIEHTLTPLTPKAASKADIDDQEDEDAILLSYWDVQVMVRRQDGGILIGWQRFGENYSEASSPDTSRYIRLVPDVDRDERLRWYKCDTVIVLRRSHRVSEEAGRKCHGISEDADIKSNGTAQKDLWRDLAEQMSSRAAGAAGPSKPAPVDHGKSQESERPESLLTPAQVDTASPELVGSNGLLA